MMITGLEIENFTTFRELKVELSPRINVIIGSNGTGKTHLLKAIYALALSGQIRRDADGTKNGLEAALSDKILRLFLPAESRIGGLRSHGARERAMLSARKSDETSIAVSFNSHSTKVRFESGSSPDGTEPRPVFIPTKEVLSLVRGMRDPRYNRATVELIFDDSYIDLAEQLVRPGFEDEASSINEDPRLSSVVRQLVNLIGGRYRLNAGGGFSFEAGAYEEKPNPERSKAKHAQAYQDSTVTRFVRQGKASFASSMTAEGFRKIGVLHRLLCNGSINPGSTGVLLWDEPEANLNPKLMKKLVHVLLELSRNGQQIVLATHDYVLLKWLDLLMDKDKEDHVRFHALYRDPSPKQMSVESSDSYSLISKSAISNTFAELFDEDLVRALG
ncbi:ATP-binding protein [Mesorhizobium sp.]|uniref:AAA family ATPase n=1 Tax=Mesorhizobium sp. TaxID=1871066 RepID=UPI00257C10DC|nr:ATP-binding protein [Mesorhizobium sp.]